MSCVIRIDQAHLRLQYADVDEAAKKEVKDILLSYDRTLLVADPRRCEPKKCARPLLLHVFLLQNLLQGSARPSPTTPAWSAQFSRPCASRLHASASMTGSQLRRRPVAAERCPEC